MNRTLRWLGASIAAALALVAGTALGEGTVVGSRPDCITVTAQALYSGFGYRHNVHVVNHCSYAVDCHVFTSVNPQVFDLHVEHGATGDVSTFLSSPASSYVAHVDCSHPGGTDPVISDPTE